MDVPSWSGEFVELSSNIYMMCLSINDERNIPTPPGLTCVSWLDTVDGDVDVYIYVREEPLERIA